MPVLPAAPLAHARALSQQGRLAEAEQIIIQFCHERLGLECQKAVLNPDGYSLNSLNGILTLRQPHLGETRLFFKYHQEEDEGKGVAEYYNSKLLEEAGLPVDVPLAARHEPGEQMLLYRVRDDARLADVCRELEHGRFSRFSAEEVVRLQVELDRAVCAKYLETLHLAPREQPARESLHQLFYHRLVDADGTKPGGRLRSYYLGQDFALPGGNQVLPWEQFAKLRWRINGVEYRQTLAELFDEALEVLDPDHLPDPCPSVLGHGDAHNANLWIEEREESARMVFFDPAFAGAHLPALLAEVKPTFHNIFAHPDWLYHPEETTQRFGVQATIADGFLSVEHSWKLSDLRQEFLRSKRDNVWKPLVHSVVAMSPHLDWERYARLALFCCPTLVMNLRPGAARHLPPTSMLGFAIAVMCGSRPSAGDDVISRFFREIAP